MNAKTRAAALRHYRRQQRITRLTVNDVQALWRLLDTSDLSRSWESGIGRRMAGVVGAGQLASARLADDYVDEVSEAEGADSDRAGVVRPSAFAGLAADGRSLESLLYLSVITTKESIGRGLGVEDAMMRGLRQALTLSGSEVAQAGRGAVGASMVGQRTIQGYVRVVNPPACSRCIILAGVEYGWNRGFQRHPRCDCVHLPTTLIARNQNRRGYIDPDAYFTRLSHAEQDRVFTAAGARAIREGADMNQVVNARRGMYTTSAYGRTLQATREGTTTRGFFYRQERARDIARGRAPADVGREYRLTTPRLLPEQIFELADSRDEAIAMLRRFAYLT
ncbi:hypothetical protein [Streptomyces bauhiniae]|uniref:Phage head morphogenesis domain-containing protein n=1 Tax=Streptomyces bauhiniae TaxID=2340725 RepID=A0A7K3QRA6_9ACTN|nr:hypothetical protein [Streptomyces bauhiniae]